MTQKTISATALRANLYQLIDQVLATGESAHIKRDGQVLELRKLPEKKPKAKKTKPKKYCDLSNIRGMDVMTEDPDWYISPKLYEHHGQIEPNSS